MGFDNECILQIQNLAGEYFCPVCRMLVYPNEALQSQCTHLYCKACLAYIVATTRACPYDGYLVTHEDSKPLFESNKTLAETIGKIDVHCLYHRSGCTWQGPLSDCPLHCSACAYGNSHVVCNRCALQIVHSQVQEHAQTCHGVLSQGQTAEGTVSSGASSSTNQLQVNMSGEVASLQVHSSHFNTSLIPSQVLNPPVSPNLNVPSFAQADLLVSKLPHQQQQYQQYAGYDPNQHQYQQPYQKQELIQNPHLQPRPQIQSLPPPMAHLQVQTLPQHLQPPSVVLTQPSAQQYPNSQAISVSNQHTELYPMIPPQSHIHFQSDTFAQPLTDQPQLHPHAPQHWQLQPQLQYTGQLRQESQLQPLAYPLPANFMNQYHPSVSYKHVDHSYNMKSQYGNPHQPFGYPIYQEGHHQLQRCTLVVQNQVTQSLMNHTELQPINQQNPLPMASSSQHHIFSTVPQLNFHHHEHHRPLIQASGQPSALKQQQVPVTHSQMQSIQSNFLHTLPRQNVPFPHTEPPHQSQSQIGSAGEQSHAYHLNVEGASFSGLHKHLGTQNGSQSELNNISVENIAAAESKDTSAIEAKAITTSVDRIPSAEKSDKEERINGSEELNSVSRSGSVLSDHIGDSDKIKSKRMDSQNIQPANEKDGVSGSVPLVLDSDRQLIVNASPYLSEGNTSLPSCHIPYSRNSFVERRSYTHHSGSRNAENLRPGCLKSWPDSLHSFGWCDEGFSTLQYKVLKEQDLQFPRDAIGVQTSPRTMDKSLYELHHDKHLQAGAFPVDNKLNLSQDFRSASSMYSRHFGLPQAIPDRELPTVSHAIRHGFRADCRLGTDEMDRSLLAPVKPLNPLYDSTDLSFISSTLSNLHPRLHRGSFSGQTHNPELSGHESISSLGEVGYRSHLLLAESQSHKGDLELYGNIRKRKAATMGWCRICEVNCDTVEGLDLHSQTREHQRMSIAMVLKIKQNSKRQSM